VRLPRDISGLDLSRKLERLGYTVTRQTGSHIRLTTEQSGEHHITIPAHDPLKPGPRPPQGRHALRDPARHRPPSRPRPRHTPPHAVRVIPPSLASSRNTDGGSGPPSGSEGVLGTSPKRQRGFPSSKNRYVKRPSTVHIGSTTNSQIGTARIITHSHIGFLDLGGFYAPLKAFLDHAHAAGFIPDSTMNHIEFSPDPDAILADLGVPSDD